MKVAGKVRRIYCHGALAVAGLLLARPSLAATLLGSVLVVAGPVLRMWAAGVLEKDGGLCTDGPYRYVRHPQYLGSLVAALGFAVMTNVVWGWGMLFPIFVAVYLMQISTEELALRRRYGEAHARYAHRVPLLLPRLGRGEMKMERTWRLARVLTNREQYHLLTTLMLVGLFVLKAQGGW